MHPDNAGQVVDEKHDVELKKTRTASSRISHHDRQTVNDIASSLRRRSIFDAEEAKEARVDPDVLDPDSEDFDPFEWAKRAIRTFNAEDIDARRQGVLFEKLSVYGSGASLRIQQTVLSTILLPFTKLATVTRPSKNTQSTILHSFDGLIESGELLLVLGRPGSGCTTFLKSITGHLNGVRLDAETDIQYRGIPYSRMIKEYRGEVLYNQEVDKHFPQLTVGETLEFAAQARAPQNRRHGLSREEYVKTMVSVIMAFFGLSHTRNTRVGNDFVRGVSGGERKRVSIAEMALSRASIGAWDNSTRGLDSASALQFIQTLRLSADLSGSCHAIAAYQASQSMYDLFDKVVVLYEGRQIYFGPCDRAVQYFEEMGWEKPTRQVSGDFLSSVTNPLERVARAGMESQVPRTPEDFEAHWRKSSEYAALQGSMAQYKEEFALDGPEAQAFGQKKTEEQANHQRVQSPYLLSLPMQLRLCLTRAYQRARNDLVASLVAVVVQIIIALVIGSVFYNTPATSDGFFQKGATLFWCLIMNALITVNEIMLLYSQREIVEKQTGYAFVHPFAEALSGIVLDLPVKFFRNFVFSIVLYFMVDLRREPSQFFIFFLFLMTTTILMSGIFRTIAASTKTIGQAMALAGICIIIMGVYTGFTVPQPYMHPWFGWLRWLNPLYYGFEAVMSNEFHGRDFGCASYVPSYPNMTGTTFVCSAVGAVAGETHVSGDNFISANYEYSYSHVWRNFGILMAYLVFFHILYLVVSEFSPGIASQPEALVFRPGRVPDYLDSPDEETAGPSQKIGATGSGGEIDGGFSNLAQQKETFMWRGLSYDIPTKDGTKRLLDDVNGWVKPGTLTALMGVSGAGKTTLLDALAQRATLGVITGEMMVSGKPLDESFPRKAGYVQQQDLHLETSTVREALRFSAVLRQPRSLPKKEKYDYVEEVIKMLGMDDFAEAVVGNPGEGLNVEQRKLLTIGVELAAKPELLIFLDEPTSGLDSQSSWAICSFMRKLTDHGQAVLATIHQPSAILFQEFDRLLFLAKGGRTVYFGDIGKQSQTLLDYFESNGARRCDSTENPAEYMLEIVNASQSAESSIDWVQKWNESSERKEVLNELDRIAAARPPSDSGSVNTDELGEFASPLITQYFYVTRRVLQQYFRQPEYILAKFFLAIVTGIFIGFSFWKADNSEQGFQDVLFSLFLVCTVFSTMVNQIIPKFVGQRALYEVRERPSRVYSWKVFILAQISAEIPWHILLGICSWACFYFAVIGPDQEPERKGLILIFVIQFYLWVSSIAHFVIAALPDPNLGAILAILLFGFSMIFNGVMQPPDDLPRFWIFMNRVSPLTYYIGGISGTALHGRPIECSAAEVNVFDPPSGKTCYEWMSQYLSKAPGQLLNGNATSNCRYCSLSIADQYLAQRNIYWDDRWRNYGLMWAYFVFNIAGAIFLYYFFRVRPYTRKANVKPTGK